MLKKAIFLLIVFTIISCTEKEVQLAEVASAEVKTVLDFSPIYVFYDTTKSDSTVLNSNNSIGNTHWVVHIDKRLSLKQVLPHIKKLQAKRKGDSPHKKEGFTNLFSVSDTTAQTLRFIDFTSVEYSKNNEFSKFYIKDHPEKYKDIFPFTINFNREDVITVNGNLVEREEFKAFIQDYVPFVTEGKNALLYANFDEHLSFQQYITNLQLVKEAVSNKIQLAPLQFVYNFDLLPDCDCDL
jgi:hypothetical protein